MDDGESWKEHQRNLETIDTISNASNISSVASLVTIAMAEKAALEVRAKALPALQALKMEQMALRQKMEQLELQMELDATDAKLQALSEDFEQCEDNTPHTPAASAEYIPVVTCPAVIVTNITAVLPVCSFCKGEHELTDCTQFVSESHDSKIRHLSKNGHCFGCLKKGHLSKNCSKRMHCEICRRKHPALLHANNMNNKQNSSQKATSLKEKPVQRELASSGHATGASKDFQYSGTIGILEKDCKNEKVNQMKDFAVDVQHELDNNNNKEVDALKEKLEALKVELNIKMAEKNGQIVDLEMQLKTQNRNEHLLEQLESQLKETQDSLQTRSAELHKLQTEFDVLMERHNRILKQTAVKDAECRNRLSSLDTKNMNPKERNAWTIEQLNTHLEPQQQGSLTREKPTDLALSSPQPMAREEGEGTEMESSAVRSLLSLEQCLSSPQPNKTVPLHVKHQQEGTVKSLVNLQYMKNVLLQFICLQSSRQRKSLLPIICTMFQLTPEEETKLAAFVMSEHDADGTRGSGWTSYLQSLTGIG